MDRADPQRKTKRAKLDNAVGEFTHAFAALVKAFTAFPKLCRELGPQGRNRALKACTSQNFLKDFSILDNDLTQELMIPLKSFLDDIAGDKSEQLWDGVLPALNTTQGV